MVELSPLALQRPGRNRYAALDGLRFLAAAGVMLFHYVALSSSVWPFHFADVAPPLFWLTKYGYFGVDLFFVISGYVILMSAWGKALPAFVASRAARLFPAYWVAVAVTGGFLLLFGARGTVTPGQVLVNFTMAQSAFGLDHVDPVYWTLWVEMHFYILIGAFLLLGLTRERILVFCVAWPLVASIAEASDAHLVSTLLQPTYAPLFAGGMLIYLLSTDPRSLVTWLALLTDVAWSFPSAGADAAEAVKRLTGAAIGDSTSVVVIAGCFALVALATLTPVRRVGWQWLTTAGLLTYPLYLIHEELGWALIRQLENRVSWPLALMSAVAMSLVLAGLIHYLIERPFGSRLRGAIADGLTSLAADRRRH